MTQYFLGLIMLMQTIKTRVFKNACCCILLNVFILFGSLGLSAVYAADDDNVKIKIIAVNPSSTQPLKSTVAQYLPTEIGPDDVLDKEGFEIKYDSDKKAYLIKKEVELQPNETKTIEVRLRNVWVVSPEEIELVKTQLKQSMDALSKTKFAATGKLLYEKANDVLAQIEENQTKQIGIMQRIELYRLNKKQLDDLKQNALSLEAMRNLEQEEKTGIREVKFFITAENPAEQEKKLTVRSPLPKDVKSDDVLDRGAFDLLYDETKESYVLQMEDTLAAKETKNYQVTLRDVWYIPQTELDFLKAESDRLIPLFVKSPYEAFSVKQGEAITASIQAINALQAEVASSTVLDERIRAHVLNDQRLKFIKRKIRELQDLLSEISLKPIAKEDLNPIKEFIRKIFDPKKHQMVEMGKDPKKPFLLIILLGIIAFLAVITVIFYGVWIRKLQDNKWKASDSAKTPTTKK